MPRSALPCARAQVPDGAPLSIARLAQGHPRCPCALPLCIAIARLAQGHPRCPLAIAIARLAQGHPRCPLCTVHCHCTLSPGPPPAIARLAQGHPRLRTAGHWHISTPSRQAQQPVPRLYSLAPAATPARHVAPSHRTTGPRRADAAAGAGGRAQPGFCSAPAAPARRQRRAAASAATPPRPCERSALC